MDKILRINVSTPNGPTAKYEPLGAYAGLGGCALAVKIAGEEIPIGCHPLGPENKVILAPGLLCGSPVATSNRLSLCSKSPLTNRLKIANSTAEAAGCMARLGIAAIIVEGSPASSDLFQIYIDINEIRIAADNGLRMRTNHQLIETIRHAYGSSISIISIGTAGEMRMASATIAFSDPELRPNRHAGRGGLGAVMGSKGIKAIILNSAGTHPRKPANPDLFQFFYQIFAERLQKHPLVGEKRLTYGANTLHRYFTAQHSPAPYEEKQSTFYGAAALLDDLGAEQKPPAQDALFSYNSTCENAPSCACLYPDRENRLPASEAVWAYGKANGFLDEESASLLSFLTDAYGLDALEVCSSLSLAMEAGLLKPDDAGKAVAFVHETGRGTAFGRLIGAGAASFAKAYGLKTPPEAHPHARPLYEVCLRAKDFACAENTQPDTPPDTAEGWSGLLPDGEFLAPPREDMVESVSDHTIAAAVMDTLGCGLSLAFAVVDQPELFCSLASLVNGFCGTKLNTSSLVRFGSLVLEAEQEFNRQDLSQHPAMEEAYETVKQLGAIFGKKGNKPFFVS